MAGIDFEGIRAESLLRAESIVPQLVPGGTFKGDEYIARLRSDDRDPSFKFNVRTGRWGDFGAGVQGGDVLDLYAFLHGISNMGVAALQVQRDMIGTPAPEKPRSRKPERTDPRPVPSNPPAFDLCHWIHGSPRHDYVWKYTDFEGNIIGYTCRFDMPDGGKDILPATWVYDNETGRERWGWKGFPEPRPMYRLRKLAISPANAPVLLVEGEKTCQAAQRIATRFVCLSWPGGGKAISHIDFSPLAGRNVIIWPDADTAGQSAAERICKRIHNVAASVRVVTPPQDVKKGWDLADAEAEGWDEAQVTAYITEHNSEYTHDGGTDVPDECEDDCQPSPRPAAVVRDYGGWPFTPLGYDHGTYYYLSNMTGQVERIAATAHSGANMLRLAVLDWWEANFPGRTGISWTRAADTCMQACHSRGVYDPDKVRGRGAWEDDGRVVLHLGDSLVVDGAMYSIADIPGSRYVYEQSRPLGLTWDGCEPLADTEAVRLLELCAMLSWERPVFGTLLAGWCAVAPICGALQWRPHIWVTGPSGAGKSWIYDNILRKSLSGFAIPCQANSTEAGLRQSLRADAMPVIFDEAESEDQENRRRIQNVLELMRQASSENGAAIIKGSSSGEAMQYRIRSCFAFSSIGVAAVQKADVSRLAVLSLAKYEGEDKAERFAEIKRVHAEIFRRGYVQRLHRRTIELVPVVRHNAEIFADAAADVLGSRRYGDQVGALLAGAYSLQSTARVGVDEAMDWVMSNDWGDGMDSNEDNDEHRCIDVIMHRQLRVETITSTVTRSIAELARVALRIGHDTHSGIDYGCAQATLQRHGLSADGEYLCISDVHPAIADTLKNTAWATTWPRILRRMPNAESRHAVEFAGKQTRAVAIPSSVIFDS